MVETPALIAPRDLVRGPERCWPGPSASWPRRHLELPGAVCREPRQAAQPAFLASGEKSVPL